MAIVWLAGPRRGVAVMRAAGILRRLELGPRMSSRPEAADARRVRLRPLWSARASHPCRS